MAKDKVKITIGADPEFTFCTGLGDKVLANKFLPQENAHNTGGEQNPKVGCDGHSETGEFRPSPQACPLSLVKELEDNIKTAARMCTPEYRIQGGYCPNNEYTGGHIHFNLKSTHNLTRCLDLFVAVPLLMISNPKSMSDRIKMSPRMRGSNGNMYGRLSDVRKPAHGGFEYRTLGSWLCSKPITAAALALSYVIADAVTNYNYKLDAKIYERYMDFEKYVSCDKTYYKDIALSTFAVIKDFPLYKKYEKTILPLYQMICKNQVWNEKRDIFLEWGTRPVKDYKNKIISSKDKFLKPITNHKYKTGSAGINLYVYGINDGHSTDILITTSTLLKLFNKTIRDVTISNRSPIVNVSQIGEKVKEYRYGIGFSLEMRKKHPDLCAEIVQDILRYNPSVF